MKPAFPLRFLSILLVLLGLLVGCGRAGVDLEDTTEDADTGTTSDAPGGDGGGDSIPVDGGDVVSISVDPAAATLPIGGTRALTARALLKDGTTADVTSSAVWTSDATTIATVSKAGVVTAVAAGAAHVRATLGAAFALATITVPAATVNDVRVDPGAAETTIGGTIKFSATAIMSDGSAVDVSSSATWAASDASIAKVSSTGLATGVASGATAVTATISGKTGTAKLSVTAKTVSSVEVAPFDPTIGVGVSVSLKATAIYTDGSSSDVTTSATWSSSAANVTVDATGKATGVSAGSATITATFSGKSGTTKITVTSASLASITVSPSAATLSAGGTARLTATGTYSDGTTADLTASAVWTSSDASIVAVSSGTIDGVAVGSATITASFGGRSGTAAITVSPLKLLSITIAPTDASLALGATLSFKATGLYEGGSTRDVTADVTWSIDDASIATISNAAGTNGRATPVAVGKTTVRAALDGVEGSTSLTVTTAAVVSIAVSPNPMSLVRSTKGFATAQATYSDGTSVDVTTTCTWSTANAAIAVVSNGSGSQGLVTAVDVGSTTLTCAFGGATGTATITVTAPTLDTITVSPIAPTCHVGDVLRFTATAISSAGTSRNVTMTATWSTSPSGLLTPVGGPPGGYRCTAKGTATVSAAFGGSVGSTPVTITDAVVTAVQVDPVTVSLPIGTVQQYVATAIYSDGSTANVTNAATWSSSSPSVAGITTGGGGPGPGGGAPGRATALSAGTTTIKATYSGFSGTATLTVTSAVLTAIGITPADTTLPVGGKLSYTATATYSDGTTRNVTAAASWTSSDTTVAQVSDAGPTRGQATALAAGTTTVSAFFGGLNGKTTLTVSAASVSSVEISPSTTSISVGATVVLRAYAVLTDGTKFEVTTSAAWTSSNTSIATVSSGGASIGQATAVATGSATITATYKGLSGTATLNVL
jgi:uncharacterized protein YjdB